MIEVRNSESNAHVRVLVNDTVLRTGNRCFTFGPKAVVVQDVSQNMFVFTNFCVIEIIFKSYFWEMLCFFILHETIARVQKESCYMK